jgi:hypothetical protein
MARRLPAGIDPGDVNSDWNDQRQPGEIET